MCSGVTGIDVQPDRNPQHPQGQAKGFTDAFDLVAVVVGHHALAVLRNRVSAVVILNGADEAPQRVVTEFALDPCSIGGVLRVATSLGTLLRLLDGSRPAYAAFGRTAFDPKRSLFSTHYRRTYQWSEAIMSPTRQQRRAAERLERPCVGHLEPGLRGAATA